jgi:hypothetical protein
MIAPGARIVSVNVGTPRLVRWRNRDVLTSIFKDPAAGGGSPYKASISPVMTRLTAACTVVRTKRCTPTLKRTSIGGPLGLVYPSPRGCSGRTSPSLRWR